MYSLSSSLYLFTPRSGIEISVYSISFFFLPRRIATVFRSRFPEASMYFPRYDVSVSRELKISVTRSRLLLGEYILFARGNVVKRASCFLMLFLSNNATSIKKTVRMLT